MTLLGRRRWEWVTLAILASGCVADSEPFSATAVLSSVRGELTDPLGDTQVTDCFGPLGNSVFDPVTLAGRVDGIGQYSSSSESGKVLLCFGDTLRATCDFSEGALLGRVGGGLRPAGEIPSGDLVSGCTLEFLDTDGNVDSGFDLTGYEFQVTPQRYPGVSEDSLSTTILYRY